MTGKRRREPEHRGRRRRDAPPVPQAPQRPAPPIGARSVPPAVTVTPTQSRREQRAQQRRQKRRRLGVAGGAGLALAGVAAAVGITLGVRSASSGGTPPVLGQTTVLLSLTSSESTATEAALLAHDNRPGHEQGVELLLPSRVLAEVCGFGNQQLGQILRLHNSADIARGAVSQMLAGVQVDGLWAVTTDAFARLVDEVGGITVDVESNVIERQGDRRVVVLQAGSGQHLNGQMAVTYATYAPAGEDAAANLVRLQSVLDGTLAALPRDPAEVQRLLATLGPTGGSSLGAEKLADLLVGLAADERANAVLPTGLPVVKIDAGGAPAYRVDETAVRQFVGANLAESWPESARVQRKSVFVQNGVGTPNLAVSACTKLTAAGYAVAGSGNAANFGYAKSHVLVFDHSLASAEVGNDVARALGLPTDDVEVSADAQNIADVVVILGEDFKA